MQNWKHIFTSDSIGGSPPASSRRIFQLGFSLSRLATTDPAEPAPMIIKSYCPIPSKKTNKYIVLTKNTDNNK